MSRSRAQNDMAGTCWTRQQPSCGASKEHAAALSDNNPRPGETASPHERQGAITTMDMQSRIDTMKLWLDELAEAYEIPDADKSAKAILTVIVKLQLRLAQHAAGAVAASWADPPEEDEGESED